MRRFKIFVFFVVVIVGFPEVTWAAKEGGKFVILPFTSLSRDRGTSWLGVGIPAEISRRFENYRPFSPAYPEKIFPPGTDFVAGDLAEERAVLIAKTHGVKFILTGSVAGHNWEPRITVSVIEAMPGGSVRRISISLSKQLNSMLLEHRREGPLVSELDLIDDLCAGIMREISLIPDEATRRAMRAAPYRDRYSFFLFAKGLGFYYGLGYERNRDSAINIFSRLAHLIDPNCAMAHRFFAAILSEMEDGKRAAIAEYETAASLNKSDYVSRLALSRFFAGDGEFQKALPYAREARDIRPDEAKAQHLVGELAWKIGLHEEAESALRRVVKIEPRRLSARRILARIYAARNSGGKLIGELEFIVNVEPRDIDSYLELASAYRKYATLTKAEETYRAIIKTDPRCLMAYKALGDICRRTGRTVEAFNLYANALKVAPADARFAFLLGEMSFDRRDFLAAENYFQRARRNQKLAPYIARNIEIISAARGDVADAGKLVRLFPDAFALEGIISSIRANEIELGISRVKFHASAYAVVSGIAKSFAEKNAKRVCPASRLGKDYLSAYEEYGKFTNLGGQFEQDIEKLKIVKFFGEDLTLTSSGREEVAQLISSLRDFLQDLREIRFVALTGLPAEIAYGKCSPADFAEIHDERLQKIPEAPPPALPSESKAPNAAAVPAPGIGTIISIDNRYCAKPFRVFIDGVLAGRVLASAKMSFRVTKGYHSLCIFEEESNLQCGQLGTKRYVFQSDFTFTIRCE